MPFWGSFWGTLPRILDRRGDDAHPPTQGTCQMTVKLGDTVDGWNPANQLRLVVNIPLFTRFYIFQVVGNGISKKPSTVLKQSHCSQGTASRRQRHHLRLHSMSSRDLSTFWRTGGMWIMPCRGTSTREWQRVVSPLQYRLLPGEHGEQKMFKAKGMLEF